MKKFGLIGHPVAHSLSPALFKAGYDGRYPYDLIETSDFEEAYQRFLEDYDGINVTAPFKELAFARADILSDECKVIRATNLLVRTPEGVKAYNSDYLGVRMWLYEVMTKLPSDMCPTGTPPTTWAPPPAARGVARLSDTYPTKATEGDHFSRRPVVLIVGMGGAGKAAAIAAASLGMDLILMNRNRSKAEAVSGIIATMPEAPAVKVRALEEFRECFREADIILYNIPAAIPELKELRDKDFTPSRPKFIMEANYKNPSCDDVFLAKMRNANPMAEYTRGQTWLLYQAITGYEIFTGEKPDLASMSAVL